MSALLANLPADSALRRALGLDWTVANELLAVNTEITYELYRVGLATGGVKKHRLPKPLHIPRPGQSAPSTKAPTRRRAASVEEVIAVLTAGHAKTGG